MSIGNQQRRYDELADLVAGIAIGLIFTQIIVGLDKINPAFIDWILVPGSDTSYHYLAWEYFKDTPWRWPLGRLEGYAYPMYNSVMYTDSIPLLAFVFKFFRFLLPDDFQYFGIWHASCYILNAYLGIKICRQIGWSSMLSWMMAPLFAGSVVLVARFGHAALCGQWVILYALLIYLRRNQYAVLNVKLRLGALVFITSLIHPYLLFMVLGLVAATPIQLKYEHRIRWTSMLGFILICMALTLFGWYISGAFLFKGQLSEGLGRYSANLNTLFNAWDVGRLGKSFKYWGDGQGEGIGYLGFGIIILFILLICYDMIQRWMNRNNRVSTKSNSLNWFLLVCIVFFVFALSPKWTLGDHLLIDWGYNDYISRTFRGTGRFIWPLHYIILFWVSRKLFLLRFKTSYNVILLLIVLILQTLDLSPLWKRKPYIDERFNNLTFGNQIKHLISLSNKVLVYPPYTSNIAGYCDYIYFVDIAQHYRKPITAGYGARFPEQIGRAFRDSVADLSNYLKDHPQDIVVTNADSLLLHQHLIKSLGGKSYQFDRYRVYLPPSLVSKSIQSMVDDDSWQVTAKSEAISLKDYLSASLDDYICGVVQQEAMSGIKKETKEFLKSRGAPMDSIVFGTSWAFVWYGGKFIRQHYSNSMAVHDSIQLQGCTTPIHVNLLSGGHLAGKNESSIRVNGVEHSKMKRGLNLIVMDSCGQVKDKVHMDGYVSDAWIVR